MTKQTNQSHKKNRQISQRFTGLLIIFGALTVLAVFGLFYWQKISSREKLAMMLPADQTVAFLEFNLDPTAAETQELQKLLAQNPDLQANYDNLLSLIPHQQLFWAWFNGRGGLAVLSNQQGQGLETVIFLQKSSQEKTLDWINELVLDPQNDAILDEDYYGQKLLSFRSGQTYNLMLTSEYLIIAENRDNLKLIAETIGGHQKRLRQLPIYNQLISALPDQNIFFLYLNRDKVLQVLSHNSQFLSGRIAFFKLYFPFLQLFSVEALAVKLEHNAEQKPVLVGQHLSLFNQSKLADLDLFATDYFYDGQLEHLLPEGTFFSAGGANLLDQKNKLQAYFKNNSTIYDLLFTGVISNLQDGLESPGTKLDLDQDFFPLFQKQYLFFANLPTLEGLATGMPQPNFGLILESDGVSNDLIKMEKVLFTIGPKLAALFDSKPMPITLPDGTVGSEMRVDLIAPAKKSLAIGDQEIEQIQFSANFSIYILTDLEQGRIILANQTSVISDIISQNAPTTVAATDYRLSKPSETYHLDLSKLASFSTEPAPWSPLSTVTIARKFTEIGLLSTYQLGF
jgi:hypothetical protein